VKDANTWYEVWGECPECGNIQECSEDGENTCEECCEEFMAPEPSL